MADILEAVTGGAATASQEASSVDGGALLISIMLVMMIIAFGFAIFIFIRNKIVYKYPVVISERLGSTRKIKNGKGGWIRKKGIRRFKIKQGWILRKVLDINPDTSLMDAEGRLHFDRLDPDTFIQKQVIHLARPTKLRKLQLLKPYMDMPINTIFMQFQHIAEPLVNDGIASYLDSAETKEEEVEDTILEPIPNDTKESAIMEIRDLENVLKRDTIKRAMIIGGIVMFAMFAVIGLYMLFGN